MNNIKFVISICTAFVVPTLVYAYNQGVTNTTLSELSGKVDGMVLDISEIKGKNYGFNGRISVNESSIDHLEGQTDKLQQSVHRNRIELTELKGAVK